MDQDQQKENTVDLRNIQLHNADLLQYDGSSHIIALLLSNCNLHLFPPITDCYNLTVLHLSSNNIGSIPSSFARLQKLKFLSMNNNSLDSFPYITLPVLTTLDLSHNKFQNNWPLPEFGNLRDLSLRSNGIENIFTSFESYPRLEAFDISNNNIIVVPTHLCRLKRLTMCCNRIVAIPFVHFHGTINLTINFNLISLLVADNPLPVNELDMLSRCIQEVEQNRTANSETTVGIVCDVV